MGVEGSADPEKQPLHFMYVLRCSDGTLYTGYTTDVERRLSAHNQGKGAKYTRSRRPVELVAQAQFASKHDAMSAEYRFKRLSRLQKERLVQDSQLRPFEEMLLELCCRVVR